MEALPMAAKYRKVDPRIWTDEKFATLNTEGKLVAMWLLTCTRVNRCGIVLWSPGLCSEETGVKASAIDTVCDTVCHTLLWIRDTVSRTVFFPNWWRYNAPDNPKALKGALSDLHDVPSGGLKEPLLLAAKELPIQYQDEYRRLLDTVWDTVSIPYAIPGAGTGAGTGTGAGERTGRKTPAAPAIISSFEEWWKLYPKRSGKEAARRAYASAVKKLRTATLEAAGMETEEAIAVLLDGVREYATSPKANGEFCWNPATWLNGGHWADDRKVWNRDDGKKPPRTCQLATEEELEFWNATTGGPATTEQWPDGTPNTDGIWHGRDLTKYPRKLKHDPQ
jgi:hypothetical protein